MLLFACGDWMLLINMMRIVNRKYIFTSQKACFGKDSKTINP